MISTGDGVDGIDLDALQRDAGRILDRVADGRELSLHLCGDDEIRSLNRDYRHKDTPTDVLSFPQDPPLLGDVVISVHTAARQAAERGHDLPTELRILLVHGVAHLLGHDHHDPDEAAAMRTVERELLAVLGIGAAGLVETGGGTGQGQG